jgi:hypothetical protein
LFTTIDYIYTQSFYRFKFSKIISSISAKQIEKKLNKKTELIFEGNDRIEDESINPVHFYWQPYIFDFATDYL